MPVSQVAAHAFCPRLAYLAWVEGESQPSLDLLRGREAHRREDARGRGAVPEEAELEDVGRWVARAMPLSSEALGLVGELDLVEGDGRTVVPVEVKVGKGPSGRVGWWPEHGVQLALQALLLREAGYQVEEGLVAYRASRRRVRVRIAEDLVQEALGALGALRAAVEGAPPPPLVDSPKCDRCSLAAVCMPDEVGLLGEGPLGEEPPEALRPLGAPAMEAPPAYLMTQGSRLRVRQGLLVLEDESGEELGQLRLPDVGEVNLVGRVGVSTPAMQLLLRAERTVAWFTVGGWFLGWAQGLGSRNGLLRLAQVGAALAPERKLALARSVVAAKLRNQRTRIRRNAEGRLDHALDELKRLAEAAEGASDLDALRGLEGLGARTYFMALGALLRPGPQGSFDWEGRNRRPPRDPVNAVLGFGYALLAKECTLACLKAGLDPHVGFLHEVRHGRPSLALDLMEAFRPVVVDAVLLRLVNEGRLNESHFERAGQACGLNAQGRALVVLAYEERLAQESRHPHLGYALSWRRAIGLEARLLARALRDGVPFVPNQPR